MQARGNTGASSASFSSTSSARHPNAQGGAFNRNRQRTSLPASANNMQRLDARFSAGAVPNFSLSDEMADTLGGHTRVAPKAFNAVKGFTANAKASNASRAKDRSDRATVEQVLDPRTRMVLFKMLNRGVFTNIHGCISTGKEANVYHAANGEGEELAIKVYKTAILVFKDRDRYVTCFSKI